MVGILFSDAKNRAEVVKYLESVNCCYRTVCDANSAADLECLVTDGEFEPNLQLLQIHYPGAGIGFKNAIEDPKELANLISIGQTRPKLIDSIKSEIAFVTVQNANETYQDDSRESAPQKAQAELAAAIRSIYSVAGLQAGLLGEIPAPVSPEEYFASAENNTPQPVPEKVVASNTPSVIDLLETKESVVPPQVSKAPGTSQDISQDASQAAAQKSATSGNPTTAGNNVVVTPDTVKEPEPVANKQPIAAKSASNYPAKPQEPAVPEVEEKPKSREQLNSEEQLRNLIVKNNIIPKNSVDLPTDLNKADELLSKLILEKNVKAENNTSAFRPFATKSGATEELATTRRSTVPIIRNLEAIYTGTELSKLPLVYRDFPHQQTNRKRGRFTVGVGSFSSVKNIYMLYGATNRCGCSSFAFSLASEFAKQSERVLLIDLNLQNPELSNSMYDKAQFKNIDANISAPFRIQWQDYKNNISALTLHCSMQDGTLRGITGNPLKDAYTFMFFSRFSYNDFLLALSEVFDYILVDMGLYDAEMHYQTSAFDNQAFRNLMVMSCRRDELKMGYSNIGMAPARMAVVLNKCEAHTNPYVIQRKVQRPVLGMLPFSNELSTTRKPKELGTVTNPEFKSKWNKLVETAWGQYYGG